MEENEETRMAVRDKKAFRRVSAIARNAIKDLHPPLISAETPEDEWDDLILFLISLGQAESSTADTREIDRFLRSEIGLSPNSQQISSLVAAVASIRAASRR